ncbi:MAG: hypothetical protein JNJ94_01375 [Chlorobi bacterium]|nr:hypothetical protein [Chlorobiota bacterium]
MSGSLVSLYSACFAFATILLSCTTQEQKPSASSEQPPIIAGADTSTTSSPSGNTTFSQRPPTVPLQQDQELVENLIRDALHHPRDARFIEIRDSAKQLLNYRRIPDGIEISDTLASGNRYLVRITKKKFHAKRHHITRDSAGWILQIDRKPYWGSDGRLPRYEIQKIEVCINGHNITIPKRAWANYYEPSLYLPDSTRPPHATVYESRDARYCYLYMSNGDAAGAYDVKFIFDHRTYITDFALLDAIDLEIDGVDGSH